MLAELFLLQLNCLCAEVILLLGSFTCKLGKNPRRTCDMANRDAYRHFKWQVWMGSKTQKAFTLSETMFGRVSAQVILLTCVESVRLSSDSEEGALLTAEEAWIQNKMSNHMIFTLWSQDDYSYRFHVVFYLCGRLERVDLLHYSHHPIPLMFIHTGDKTGIHTTKCTLSTDCIIYGLMKLEYRRLCVSKW